MLLLVKTINKQKCQSALNLQNTFLPENSYLIQIKISILKRCLFDFYNTIYYHSKNLKRSVKILTYSYICIRKWVISQYEERLISIYGHI